MDTIENVDVLMADSVLAEAASASCDGSRSAGLRLASSAGRPALANVRLLPRLCENGDEASLIAMRANAGFRPASLPSASAHRPERCALDAAGV